MTDVTQTPARNGSGRFATWPHWTKFLLIASLAANLLVLGVVGMRYFKPERFERWSGASFSQLLPRAFLSDLPEERRREFLDLLKSRRDAFRQSRADMRDAALRFADALQREPYDAAAAQAAVDDFTRLSTQMVDSGTVVTRQIVEKLTPEERALLAQKVRERVERMKQWRKKRDAEKGKEPDDT